MTGHGEGQAEQEGASVSVEVRTINNRYFKLALRTHEGYYQLEPRVESLVRKYVRRGSVNTSIRIHQPPMADDYQLNLTVLKSYRDQLATSGSDEVPLAQLLALPGVVSEHLDSGGMMERVWPLVETAVKRAMESLSEMRTQEGAAMADDLKTQCHTLSDHLDHVEELAPRVVDNYRGRLVDKVNKMLEEVGTQIELSDVAREVAIFAERVDVSEEIVRLKSHLQQFADLMAASESSGRKLEFLTQEIFRETNTIGSKCNDADIASDVIEMKAAIERIREMIQNVE